MLAITIKRLREKVVITTPLGETIEIRLAKGNKHPFARLVFSAKKEITIKRHPTIAHEKVAKCEFCLKEIPWRPEPEDKREYFCSPECAHSYGLEYKDYSPFKGGLT